jgi:hypothetical protein
LAPKLERGRRGFITSFFQRRDIYTQDPGEKTRA